MLLIRCLREAPRLAFGVEQEVEMSIFKRGHGPVGVQVVVRLKGEIIGAYLKSVITAHSPSVSTQVFSWQATWKISWEGGDHTIYLKRF